MACMMAVGIFMLIPIEIPQWLALVLLIVFLPLLEFVVVLPLYSFLRKR
jgi:hypothetical protein